MTVINPVKLQVHSSALCLLLHRLHWKNSMRVCLVKVIRTMSYGLCINMFLLPEISFRCVCRPKRCHFERRVFEKISRNKNFFENIRRLR